MDNQQESFLEIFKVIQEFPTYEIGNKGTVRNVKTKKNKYTHKHSTGYVLVQFKKGGKVYTRKVHRLVAESFAENRTGISFKSLSVKHLDNNKSNNVWTNLEWDTHLGSMRDAYLDKLIPSLQGERNGRSKLTDSVVENICADFERGLKPFQVREKYNISKQQAEKIHAGHAWLHISSKYALPLVQEKILNDYPEGE